MNIAELLARQKASQRGFFRALAGGSPGAAFLDLGGAQATLVPVREWFSIFNSAFYDDPDDLARLHPQLCAAYAAAGVQTWTVWVPPGDRRAADVLRRRGHVLDSAPMLFAAEITECDLEPRTALDLDPDPTWERVARVNDLAHGVLEPWTMAAVFAAMDDPASRLHIARHAGEPAAALIAREHGGDCYFWFVATAPRAQRAGLAAELMRHALREARRRGCTTTTLESTRAAEALYQRLGYTPLGRYEMWEARATA